MGDILYSRRAVFLSERIDVNHPAHPAVLPEHATGGPSAWARWDTAAAQAALCVLDTKLAPRAWLRYCA